VRYSRFACAVAFVLAQAEPSLAQRFQTRLIDIIQERLVEVTGEASVSTPPDFARVTLGVTTTGRDARETMAANAKAVNALVSVIKGEGVAPTDIKTSSLSIAPIASNPTSGSASPPTITGYSANDAVTVTARDLSRLGALIDKAVGAGANAVYGIDYGENDPSALLDKARPLALADAKRKAEIYARAGGATVGRLMQLSEQTGMQPAPFARRFTVQNASAAPTPIEAGDDRLTVTVTAQFELTQ